MRRGDMNVEKIWCIRACDETLQKHGILLLTKCYKRNSPLLQGCQVFKLQRSDLNYLFFYIFFFMKLEDNILSCNRYGTMNTQQVDNSFPPKDLYKCVDYNDNRQCYSVLLRKSV